MRTSTLTSVIFCRNVTILKPGEPQASPELLFHSETDAMQMIEIL